MPPNHGHRLGSLVASVEPSVVFGSLAAQCVPDLCDECTIDVVDGVHARYRIAYPPRAATAGGLLRLADRAGAAVDHQVRVPFHHPDPAHTSRSEHQAREQFQGVATFVWHRRIPTRSESAMVSLLIDNAVHTVVRQRSERDAGAAVADAAHLQLALHSSRHIGAAVGILMTLHKITEDQGFELLRQASQARNRKLRDLALEVIDTGWLEPDQ